jgi:hypothetical protein
VTSESRQFLCHKRLAGSVASGEAYLEHQSLLTAQQVAFGQLYRVGHQHCNG